MIQTCFTHWIGHAIEGIALAWPECYPLRNLQEGQYSCSAGRCSLTSWLYGKSGMFKQHKKSNI